MFAFTLMGGKVDDSVNRRGRGPYVFHLHGHTYHSMGSLLPQEGRVFQQFRVDCYTMVETERLYFHRAKQSKLRCDTYSNIHSSIAAGNTDPTVLGKLVMLSFRLLVDRDRPDMLLKVFKMKLDQLMKDVKELRLFRRVQAAVYTVEFQKRGLPHAHICLFLHKDDKVPNVEHINKYISAEILDLNDDPDLYKLVLNFMMHGPCGEDDLSQACMVDRKCSKHFPKKFMQHSSIDSKGYPVYRRRDDEKYVEKSGHRLHNGFVIPYNATLLKRYRCHINVEWCNQTGSIKYLFKYINKGPDRVSTELYEPAMMVDGEQIKKPIDEIKAYLDCRYLSTYEAAWRLFGFEVQYRTPFVERLSFHLPGEQQVLYDENSDLKNVLHKPSVGHSMFEGWMKMNELYPAARELTYAEFPTKYPWGCLFELGKVKRVCRRSWEWWRWVGKWGKWCYGGWRENQLRMNSASYLNVGEMRLQTFHVRGKTFPLRSLSFYALLPNASVTAYGPSHLAFAVLKVGMSISTRITESVPYVIKNGVSSLLDLIIVRCAHKTCEISSIQFLLLPFNYALIPTPKLMFALSTKPLAYGCLTEAKRWQIHSFLHPSLNGLFVNCFPLSDFISPSKPNLETLLSHMNFLTRAPVMLAIGTCLIENSLKVLVKVLTFSKYWIMPGSFAMPAIKASYSASLLVASNLNYRAYVNSIPSELIIIRPASEPSMHDESFIDNIYGSESSYLSSMGVSGESSSGRSTMKSVRICLLTDVLGYALMASLAVASLCSAMCRGTPVISAGFHANISRLRLNKPHSSFRPSFVKSSGIILLLHNVTVPPVTGNLSIL
nr:hypothetical protein [Tanacetum cinerariifolium]